MNRFIKVIIVATFCALPFLSQPLMAGKPPAHIMAFLMNNTPLKPTKVFDNVYCIGSVSVTTWAIKTSEGIILIDSMWDDNDAKMIEKGMIELGLDPKDLKYILVSHGHGDHYGGAKYLADKYHAKVAMTKVDTDFMNTLNKGPNGPRSPKAPVSMFLKDGDVVTLGDRSVKILVTPGHTPGGMSFIFPVMNDGEKHNAILWGGTGIPRDMKSKLAYKKSVEHFITEAKKVNADVSLTAHLFIGSGFDDLKAAGIRKKGEKNPFILGKDGIQKYYTQMRESINKAINN
ncbi:MBL fold metallo-hydrolase [Sulfurospirillum arcachonense]|uniref:MBL fold metallo-hydrolase n=1 Tax=Sulfurospirillum arcachonense TaxID=57666 RepID=UPI0004B64F3E|nr:MBL fold metallo-hydrolase [Sulfurospirillum arcachonense]